MLGGLPQQHVAMTGLVQAPGLVQSKLQPPAPAAPCASGPGAGTHVGAPNTCPRSTSIFPRLLWSQTANTLCPRALALPPLLTPLCFSCSLSPLTDHRGWYYYNPWLNLNPPPILCFSGGEWGVGRRESMQFCGTCLALELVLVWTVKKPWASMQGVPPFAPLGKVPRVSCSLQ